MILGNWDDTHEAGHVFTPSFVARSVRLKPESWYGQVMLRFEIYGCPELNINGESLLFTTICMDFSFSLFHPLIIMYKQCL